MEGVYKGEYVSVSCRDLSAGARAVRLHLVIREVRILFNDLSVGRLAALIGTIITTLGIGLAIALLIKMS